MNGSGLPAHLRGLLALHYIYSTFKLQRAGMRTFVSLTQQSL